MPSASPNEETLRFEGFELNLRAGELYKSGRKVRLQALPLRILVTLLEMPGQVVTREELRRAIWPTAAFGSFDEGLDASISKVRSALGEGSTFSVYLPAAPVLKGRA